MLISEEQLKKVLLRTGLVNESQFEDAANVAGKTQKPIEEILVYKDLISDEHLGQLLANEAGFNFVNLRKEAIDREVLKIIPELVAKNQKIVAFDKTKEGLKVAMASPGDYEMVKWLEKKTGDKVIVYYATAQDIHNALRYYRKEIEKTFEEIIKEQTEMVSALKAETKELPIIKIVDILVGYAYENRASDVHIEPLESETRIRFRIDGILHNVLSLPKEIHDLIIARIKVLAKLRTDEHLAAQDGKFEAKFEEEKFDIRVSVVPVGDGENVVLRLLSERARRFNLESLGLLDRDFKKIQAAIQKPYGMILATGPTGCGKTTTLYAILKILNRPEVNICTIEDPVEYDIEGASQIQVNPKTNLTFAQGLRSIVRQDPNIIMVGEIRDSETAGIAINSAMTGHLVLSTMHANTASTTLPRLIDMGVEPFLIASSINIISAQRLVRKICAKCRESYEVLRSEIQKLNLSPDLVGKLFGNKKKIRIYRGKGCRACFNTGYSGRTGIFEVLQMEDSIRKLIMLKANADQIQGQAIKKGMVTMIEDGLEKVLLGITTIEEIIRVSRE